MPAFRILVVDDDPVSRRLVRGALRGPEFDVQEARDGAEALERVRQRLPDLIVCDYDMPRMDGVELVRRVREDPRQRLVPVIMLTAHTSVEATVTGLEAGADDYVNKPFRLDELRTRVLAQLRRQERDLSADPRTLLPSGASIQRDLELRIARNEPFAAIYADLDHFKPYVDRFGFVRAGHVVEQTARILMQCMNETVPDEAFVGHIAGDDFIATCPAHFATQVCERLIREFDCSVPQFYDAQDLVRGYIEGEDREGKLRRFPLLAISLCVVDSRRHRLGTPADVARLASGARSTVKARPESCFVVV